jgi:hypothetical protein
MGTNEPVAADDEQDTTENRADRSVHDTQAAPCLLPSRGRLLLFAVLLPATVATSNQALLQVAQQGHLQFWLYPWLALSAAALSWCSGKYVRPPWLAWLVFAWCVTLLDLITVAACLAGPVSRSTAFVLVAAQASVLAVWAMLANVNWQHRLPAALVAASILIAFAGIWRYEEWSVLVCAAVFIVVIVCGILRWIGFRLNPVATTALAKPDRELATHQFGTRHLLIWSAAIAPALLVARGIDYWMFAGLAGKGTLPAALISLSVAVIALVVIWAVVGQGPWVLRVAMLVTVPPLLAFGLNAYTRYTIRAPTFVGLPQGMVVNALWNMRNSWASWLGLFAALLAALLLFLRASAYRLERMSRTA